MSNDEVHSVLFRQSWNRCTLRLVSGDRVTVDHPDYFLMPPDRSWVLWVKPEGKGLQFIPPAHIAAIDLESKSIAAG